MRNEVRPPTAAPDPKLRRSYQKNRKIFSEINEKFVDPVKPYIKELPYKSNPEESALAQKTLGRLQMSFFDFYQMRLTRIKIMSEVLNLHKKL